MLHQIIVQVTKPSNYQNWVQNTYLPITYVYKCTKQNMGHILLTHLVVLEQSFQCTTMRITDKVVLIVCSPHKNLELYFKRFQMNTSKKIMVMAIKPTRRECMPDKDICNVQNHKRQKNKSCIQTPHCQE